MDIREAVADLDRIHRRMAEVSVFRGYRATPVAISGLAAMIAGALQPYVLPAPEKEAALYVAWWSAVASVSVIAAIVSMILQYRINLRRGIRSTAWPAISRFVPALIAGMIVSAVLLRTNGGHVTLLPGLWQLFFSLGIFASARQLPRGILVPAFLYMACGSAVLLLSDTHHALAPWVMAIPFGAGQSLTALVLYLSLERADA